ncbi:transcription initiation Spt4 [Sistotremastrum niveocremeum HHB9708]|uniref:Transcription elongation factor SPT4 n=2 Tax=Sistotremastraceae TaxID=3402574 RepID=A0A164VCF0_9AGAM|nr:transcription initiation Spt4 [Sistotremastrum niveocremeum HHB9708]KZT36795.1 transcription initiation Spt4 [Sistotremastrum suecicum HHB10207 ss-3]
MSAPVIPNAKSRQLRACLLCSIVLTPQDFRRTGCPNCDEITKMKGDSEKVTICTTANFEGMIALVDPQTSWVGRWQRVSNYVRGIYAARVTGPLPEEVMDELSARGLTYRPRDQNTSD